MNAEKEKRLHAKCKRQGSEIARLTQLVAAQRAEIATKRVIIQNGLADVDGWKIDGAAEIARHHKPRGKK